MIPFRPRLKILFFLIFITLLQAIFLFKFLPIHQTPMQSPILTGDHSPHHLQLTRVRAFLKKSRSIWGYDPAFMAGYPTATFDLVDSVGAIITISFFSLFLPVIVAIKLFIIVAFIFIPFIMFFICRNFSFNKKLCKLCSVLTIITCNIFIVYRLRALQGGYSFLLSTVFGLLCFSLAYRYLEKGKKFVFTGYLITGIYGFSLHLLFPLVISPLFIFYFLFEKRLLNTLRLKYLALGMLAIIIINLFWLLPILSLLNNYTPPVNYRLAVGHVIGIKSLLHRLTTPSHQTGYFLLVIIFLSPLYIGKNLKNKLILTLWSVFCLAFIVSHFKLGWLDKYIINTEPQKFQVLSIFLMPILLSFTIYKKFPQAIKILTNILFCLIFIQILLISTMFPGNWNKHYSPLQQWLMPPLLKPNISHLNPLQEKDIAWLTNNLKNLTNPSGRILMQSYPKLFYGSQLLSIMPHYLKREFIASPIMAPKIKHDFASFNRNIIFKKKLNSIETWRMMKYIELYNIKWVVVCTPTAKKYFNQKEEDFTLIRKNKKFHIFEVNQPHSFFIKGSGEISASLNEIIIDNASKGEIIIKYHYFDKLKSEPQVIIERKMYMDDPVGFIKINNTKGHKKIRLYL